MPCTRLSKSGGITKPTSTKSKSKSKSNRTTHLNLSLIDEEMAKYETEEFTAAAMAQFGHIKSIKLNLGPKKPITIKLNVRPKKPITIKLNVTPPKKNFPKIILNLPPRPTVEEAKSVTDVDDDEMMAKYDSEEFTALAMAQFGHVKKFRLKCPDTPRYDDDFDPYLGNASTPAPGWVVTPEKKVDGHNWPKDGLFEGMTVQQSRKATFYVIKKMLVKQGLGFIMVN